MTPKRIANDPSTQSIPIAPAAMSQPSPSVSLRSRRAEPLRTPSLLRFLSVRMISQCYHNAGWKPARLWRPVDLLNNAQMVRA
jgi:hypothetical protein